MDNLKDRALSREFRCEFELLFGLPLHPNVVTVLGQFRGQYVVQWTQASVSVCQCNGETVLRSSKLEHLYLYRPNPDWFRPDQREFLAEVDEGGNIGRVFDAQFVLMEYIPLTLKAYICAGPMDVITFHVLALDVLHALEFLQRHGIVHFDVKPDNILIQIWTSYERGKCPRAVVCDFGCARLCREGQLRVRYVLLTYFRLGGLISIHSCRIRAINSK